VQSRSGIPPPTSQSSAATARTSTKRGRDDESNPLSLKRKKDTHKYVTELDRDEEQWDEEYDEQDDRSVLKKTKAKGSTLSRQQSISKERSGVDTSTNDNDADRSNQSSSQSNGLLLQLDKFEEKYCRRIVIAIERQGQTLKKVIDNQKKVVKGLRKHQVSREKD
jgi:hypothetical protein